MADDSRTNRLDVGNGEVQIVALDRISADHLMENMMEASVYSLSVGQDHLPSVTKEVKDFLFNDNITI